jgi:hypothetical protein
MRRSRWLVRYAVVLVSIAAFLGACGGQAGPGTVADIGPTQTQGALAAQVATLTAPPATATATTALTPGSGASTPSAAAPTRVSPTATVPPPRPRR